jgi:hypothetical protein
MSGGAEVLDAYGEEKVSEARAAGISGLCEILSSSSEGVRMTAARMLCALCDSTTVGHSDARKEFRDAGGIPVLVVSNSLHWNNFAYVVVLTGFQYLIFSDDLRCSSSSYFAVGVKDIV